MNPRYAPMFAPYTLNNGVAIKNRFVVAPLTIYESDANGGLTDAARNFWRDRFRGFGLFVMPFTNVHPTGIGFPSPNAFDASHLPTLREYTAISHEQGAKIVAQIAHAGSRANPLMTRGLGAVAPSAYGRVREMSSDEVAANGAALCPCRRTRARRRLGRRRNPRRKRLADSAIRLRRHHSAPRRMGRQPRQPLPFSARHHRRYR